MDRQQAESRHQNYLLPDILRMHSLNWERTLREIQMDRCHKKKQAQCAQQSSGRGSMGKRKHICFGSNKDTKKQHENQSF
jgi:hypothetical protein